MSGDANVQATEGAPETVVRASRKSSSPPRRRRQEILDAAARVFHERGYDSTSIEAIADEVGILKGSLYYYISSKEDLLHEILQNVHRDALANVERLDASEGTAADLVREFVVAHLTFNAQNLTRMGVFLHDFRSLAPDRQLEIVAARDVYEQRLRDLIEAGHRDGSIDLSVEPKVGAIAIMGMLNWIYQWYRPDGPIALDELANGFADFALYGLVSRPSADVVVSPPTQP